MKLDFEAFDKIVFEPEVDIKDNEGTFYLISEVLSNTNVHNIDFNQFSFKDGLQVFENILYYSPDENETFEIFGRDINEYNRYNLLYEINRIAHLYKTIAMYNSQKSRKFI